MNIENKISEAEVNLQRKLEWVGRHDSKILFLIYRSQYPKTFSSNTSLNYFGTIADMKFDEFKRRTKQATDEEYLDDLLCQIHINSQVLKLKFRFLKIALILLGVSVLPWLICLYTSHEYLK
jgi:hypothetical protein